MKKTKIQIPADCEVDKIETQEGFVVVTYKKKERKLPKSWKEFCDMFPNKEGEFLVSDNSDIYEYTKSVERDYKYDKNLLPDRDTAEAVLALCQLIQLRNCYNGDWVPDWKDADEEKYIIAYGECGDIEHWTAHSMCHLLAFKTEELRDDFLRNFRPLIEKLKPLYGIGKGVKMIDDKCKEIKCEYYIEWSFGYGMCYSCNLQGESYHIEKPAEDRNCPLYGIKEGGDK